MSTHGIALLLLLSASEHQPTVILVSTLTTRRSADTQRVRSRFAGVVCAAVCRQGESGSPDAGPKRPMVDRSQNDFNLHDFPLHSVASRGPSAPRGTARFFVRCRPRQRPRRVGYM